MSFSDIFNCYDSFVVSSDKEYKMIKIVVLGTSGVNFINRFKEEEISCFELISICSNKDILESSKADKKLFVGDYEFGCGGDIEKGEIFTTRAEKEIKELLVGGQRLFILAFLGGGLTCGGLPVIAKFAKELELNPQIIVTLPFSFEGDKRNEKSFQAIYKTQDYVDDIVMISNDIILRSITKQVSMKQAFGVVDELILQKIKENI